MVAREFGCISNDESCAKAQWRYGITERWTSSLSVVGQGGQYGKPRNCLRTAEKVKMLLIDSSNRRSKRSRRHTMLLVFAIIVIQGCCTVTVGAQKSEKSVDIQDKNDHQPIQEAQESNNERPAGSADHSSPSFAKTHLFWAMRGKKSTNNDVNYPNYDEDNNMNGYESDLTKREITAYSNWGSNPYLLGKRFQNPSFWAARGKKNADGNRLGLTENLDYDNNKLNTESAEQYKSVVRVSIPQLLENIDNYGTDSNDYLEQNSQSPVSAEINRDFLPDFGEKRRDGLFWASRGKRERNNIVEAHDKRSKPVKMTPLMKEVMSGRKDDNSKFWMSRGRRFWAARGKKSNPDSSKFNRIARLVNSNIKHVKYLPTISGSSSQNPSEENKVNLYYMDQNLNDLGNPNFWVVRGKKYDKDSDISYDDLDNNDYSMYLHPGERRDKKSFKRLPDFSRVAGRSALRTPNFWASRGRKNFWAARGKRSIIPSSRK